MKRLDSETKALSALHFTLSMQIESYPDRDWSEYPENQRQELNRRLGSSMEYREMPRPEASIEGEQQYRVLRQRLLSARDQYDEYMRWRRDIWLAFAEPYDEQMKKALKQCIDSDFMYHYGFFIHADTGSLGLTFDACASYRQTIYFSNPIFSGSYDDSMPVEDMLVHSSECGYQLSFMQQSEIITVDFSDMTLDIQLLNYSMVPAVNGSAWSIVSGALSALSMKRSVLGDEYLNPRERALWRLNEFCLIHGIDSRSSSICEDEEAGELFYAYAVKAENVSAAEKIRRYLYAGSGEASPERQQAAIKQACRALRYELAKPESAVLAWLILTDIKQAASGYPAECAPGVPAEEHGAAYRLVSETLRAKGYEGEYPHFRKMSAIRGIRLADMQGQPVCISREKHMASMIDCFDCCTGFQTTPILFNFAVSTMLLGEENLHRYSSLNGTSGYSHRKDHRRRFRSVIPRICLNEDDAAECLPQSILAAAKTAELEKLSAAERKRYSISGKGDYGVFSIVVMALLSGTFFGLIILPFLALAALLIGIPATLISSNTPTLAEFLQMLLKLPWHYAFAFCILGFGVPMATVFALSRRRG